MRRMLRSKRGVTSIIATIVIFTVMVGALGLALSQIIPSMERFQTESDLTAATNAFLSFDSEIKNLMNTPENSSSVIRYNINNGILDLLQDRELFLVVKSGGEELLNYTCYTGEVVYRLEGNFKGLGGAIYDFGSPVLLVYSINRTTQMTNIVHQTFDNYKLLKLYYSVFLNIEQVSDSEIEINFIIIHLNTTKTVEGQGEYFPIINTQTKIQITKQSQLLEIYHPGNRSDDLSIEARTTGFSQVIEYPIAPATFDLTINLIHINIDFRTV